MVIGDKGSVYAWGSNWDGILGNPLNYRDTALVTTPILVLDADSNPFKAFIEEAENEFTEGTEAADRKSFRYYVGLDERGKVKCMLVAPAGNGVGETVEQDGFVKDDVLDSSTNKFKKGIYYINKKGAIKQY